MERKRQREREIERSTTHWLLFRNSTGHQALISQTLLEVFRVDSIHRPVFTPEIPKICNYDSHFWIARLKLMSILSLFSNLIHEPSRYMIQFFENR